MDNPIQSTGRQHDAVAKIYEGINILYENATGGKNDFLVTHLPKIREDFETFYRLFFPLETNNID